MRLHNRIKAFTLLEILLVVALLAMLALISLVAVNPVRNFEAATLSKVKSEISDAKRAIELYIVDHKGGNVTANTGIALPTVTSETLISSGVELSTVDGIVPDYMDSEHLEKLSSKIFVGRTASGQITVGTEYKGSIYSQVLYYSDFIVVSASPTAVPGGCLVTYNVTNQWADGFVASVSITNQSSVEMTNWSIAWTFSGNQAVTSAWDISMNQAGATFTGSNLGYNNVIAANGGVVSFGFQASFSGGNYAPQNSHFVVNGQTCTSALVNVIEDPGLPPAENLCEVNYAIQSQWANGFVVSVTMTNLSSIPINGWTLAWTFPGDQVVTDSWNTSLIQTGQSVSAQDSVYNANIPANSAVTFGFQGSYSGTNTALLSSQFTLNGTACQ